MKLHFHTMKTLVFFFLLGCVWQLSDASGAIETAYLRPCLIGNGFTDSTADVERIYAIGDPKQADKLKDVPKEKMANLIACLYHKMYPGKNLYSSLRQLLDRDDKVPAAQVREMEVTVTACLKKAATDDAKLLNCVNITEPPFDHLFVVIRDVREAMHWCFVRCNILISEMYTMDTNRDKPLREYIDHVSNEKLGCFMACKAEEGTIIKPDLTFQKGLTNLINSEKVDENKKKEMLASLSKCGTEVAGKEYELYLLVKCLNLLQPPFLDLFYNVPLRRNLTEDVPYHQLYKHFLENKKSPKV